MATPRAFSFFRAGGFDQVRFMSGADLLDIDQLDLKLWVALACPTKGLSFDTRTLELIDEDKDGRIRAGELISSVKWAGGLLKDAEVFVRAPQELPLAEIDVSHEEGRRVHQAAKTVLAGLAKADATAISVGDSAAAVKAFESMAFNGDGVIPADSASTPDQKQLIEDVLVTFGGADDKSGKKGVTAPQVEAFFKAVDEYRAWLATADGDVTVMALKAETRPAYDAFAAVRAKVDDYFARCRLAAFDARAAAALNREEKEYLAVAAKDLTITSAEIRGFPLSRIEANRALPLLESVNPAWEAELVDFGERAVRPLLGARKALTEDDWKAIKAKLAPFEAWQQKKAGQAVERLGEPRLRVLAATDQRELLAPLFAHEAAQEATAQRIISVERLVRYARDLYRLANNFVAFREFYERKTPAMFQVGTLFLDQRACELVIRVEDAAKHAAMAPLSRAFLAYCECTRPATNEKMSVVAAITAGDSDNLMVGRNGILYDREGRDWDATVTRIVDNPISIRQSFWSPYKKLIRFVEEQVAMRAAAADKESNAMLTSHATQVGRAAETGKVSDNTPKKLDVGVVAAMGVAVGGVTAALGALLQAFFGLGLWMPLGFLALVMAISGPSMLIAWLKLRQRNVGPLLDANGWAVNANAMLNVPFGGSLTKLAVLPHGSHLDKRDPYAEARRPWRLATTAALLAAAGVAWYLGRIDHLLPRAAHSTQVLGEAAPAWRPESAAPTPPSAPSPSAKATP